MTLDLSHRSFGICKTILALVSLLLGDWKPHARVSACGRNGSRGPQPLQGTDQDSPDTQSAESLTECYWYRSDYSQVEVQGCTPEGSGVTFTDS